MAAALTSGLRRSLVAALIITLTLAGLGRAVASAPRHAGIHDVIAGVPVPICHSGEAPADPAQPGSHDCCDDCALPALATLPAPPVMSRPAPAAEVAAPARGVTRAPVIARPRDPRLSRGPPSA